MFGFLNLSMLPQKFNWWLIIQWRSWPDWRVPEQPPPPDLPAERHFFLRAAVVQLPVGDPLHHVWLHDQERQERLPGDNVHQLRHVGRLRDLEHWTLRYHRCYVSLKSWLFNTLISISVQGHDKIWIPQSAVWPRAARQRVLLRVVPLGPGGYHRHVH